MPAAELTEASLADIGGELGVTFAAEPYRLRGEAVFSSDVAGTRLVVWPSIGRVDVYCGRSRIVFKGIREYEIIPGVEVVFRRADGGHLFLTSSGQVNVAV